MAFQSALQRVSLWEVRSQCVCMHVMQIFLCLIINPDIERNLSQLLSCLIQFGLRCKTIPGVNWQQLYKLCHFFFSVSQNFDAYFKIFCKQTWRL